MKRVLLWLRDKLIAGLKKLTRAISTATTAAILTVGALVGVHGISGEFKARRLLIAGMAFVIGLPLGVIIFGAGFNILVWAAMVVGALFLMNLHNMWEVIVALRYGGLEFVTTASAIEAVEAVVPTEEDITKLREQFRAVEKQFNQNALRTEGILGQRRELTGSTL